MRDFCRPGKEAVAEEAAKVVRETEDQQDMPPANANSNEVEGGTAAKFKPGIKFKLAT